MKKYLVVGGSSGIGLEVVKSLTEKGHEVIAVSRSLGELEKLVNVKHIVFDVCSDSEFVFHEDSIDGMVYCPGSINLKPFHRVKPEEFVRDFDINVLGAIRVLQCVLPALQESDQASVVFFSTVAVQQGMGFHSSVAASKGAIEGLTRSLAAEFAPKIRVNCIAPSVTDTPLAERLLSSPERREAAAKRHPLLRIGSPRDMANSVLFLLAEESAWITGQVLAVDGGLSSLKMI